MSDARMPHCADRGEVVDDCRRDRCAHGQRRYACIDCQFDDAVLGEMPADE